MRGLSREKNRQKQKAKTQNRLLSIPLSLYLPITLFLTLIPSSPFASSPASHCLSLYDPCKYAEGFTRFEYVNPNAPKGGTVKLAETGSFDSLNPFILNGVKAPGIGGLFDTLMVSSKDEPQTMYGLIAEKIALAKDRSSATFYLRKNARFHDGSAITADDVVFSFETLKEKGDPTYKILFAPIASVKKAGAREVTFTFTDTKNREIPMIAAGIPIISKAYYTKHDFNKTTLEAPLGSGAYRVQSVDPGRAIIYERVKGYWAKDLPVNRGQYNFDVIRFEMYRDENVTLEALKAGAYDFRREYIARNWATAYDTPAIKKGLLIKRNVPDYTPQGMQSFVFNTRKPYLSDRRVREAISIAMDYEWLNKTIFYGAYARNRSFFTNTDFEAKDKPNADELKLLEPFRNSLPPALFEGEFVPSTTDGSGNARAQLLRAQTLLNEAGWKVKNGKRVDASGEPMKIEFMLRQPTMERVIGPMRKNLERLGISSSIRMVDDAQYQKRTDSYDFDIVSIWINRGVFYPGNEQVSLWQSKQADIKGGNNLSGAKNPVVDTLLESLINAKDKRSLLAAGRALDRVLLFEHYVIPNWYSSSFRIAYWDKFGIPETFPKYDLGFNGWWMK